MPSTNSDRAVGRSFRCCLGHTRKAMECPGCAEANGSETTPEWWRWYRSRTSSKAVKQAITDRLAALR